LHPRSMANAITLFSNWRLFGKIAWLKGDPDLNGRGRYMFKY